MKKDHNLYVFLLVDMAPFYKYLTEALKLPFDSALYARMEAANKEELQRFDDKAQDAEQNMGETEVNEALLGKADYYAMIGDKVWISACFPLLYLIIPVV